jgi:hypothetical protein
MIEVAPCQKRALGILEEDPRQRRCTVAALFRGGPVP